MIPFSRPSIGNDERTAVLRVLDSGWLTAGPVAREFEEAFAAFVGSRYAVAVNSCTAALHLGLEAVGVGPGDEVLVPTWTFAASASVITHLGATPVLVDVDPVTLNANLAEHIGPRTRAAVAVHFAGLPADVSEVPVPVVEDAAHAFPSRLPSGRMAGTTGVAGAFSFYATKTITTGEGGMLVTDDERIAKRARLMSLHGINRDAWQRYGTGGSWRYDIEAAGFKYNISDLAASIGLAQLRRADELHRRRRSIAARYTTAFRGLVETPVDDSAHAWHLYVIRVDRRDEVVAELTEAGIGTSVHFMPLHLHRLYRDWSADRFPVATREFERVISLPIWPDMTDDEVNRVIEAVSSAVAVAA